jgi:hypothetical protein
MLLLGSSAHVHLTPHAVYALPEEGLSRPNASILLLSSQGTEPTLCRADRLTKFERAKLYLTWGHAHSDYAEYVSPLAEVTESLAEESVSRRGVSRGSGAKPSAAAVACDIAHAREKVRVAWSRFLGQIKVEERPERYPESPIDTYYYEDLLASSTNQTPEERESRKLLRGSSARGSNIFSDAGSMRSEHDADSMRSDGAELSEVKVEQPMEPLEC